MIAGAALWDEERECFVSCGFVGTMSPSASGAEDGAKIVQVLGVEATESERRRFCAIVREEVEVWLEVGEVNGSGVIPSFMY